MSDEPAAVSQIGRYRVLRWLGEGAMGRVLLARDPVLERDVAIKVLRDDLKLEPGQLASLIDRMRHEARAGARVLHPNIVALFDMGEDAELGLYIVFEYVEGPTLKDEIERRPIPPERAAKLAQQIGSALSTAHAAGVLHRDVKPENVILAPSGAKVADFGIARIPNSTLTRDGGVLGTPAYSSPEAVRDGAFSAASDQFSFAATMYEAISGTRAFPGDDATAVAESIATRTPDPIAKRLGLEARVDQVLLRALAKDPAMRYPSAEDFGRALSEALGGGPRPALPTLPDQRHLEQATRQSERHVIYAAVGGFVLGGAITWALTLLLADGGEPSSPSHGDSWIIDSAAPRPAPSAPPNAVTRPGRSRALELRGRKKDAGSSDDAGGAGD